MRLGRPGHRQSGTADQVNAAVELFKNERQRHTGGRVDGLFQFKDGFVRPARLRINAPSGFWIAVEGLSDGPARLIEIGNRPVQFDCFGAAVIAGCPQFEFGGDNPTIPSVVEIGRKQRILGSAERASDQIPEISEKNFRKGRRVF